MQFGLTLDIGIILALAAVFFELRSQRNRDRELARRDQERSQFEIYQRLELASNDLHRFEADHLDLIRPLYTGKGAPTDPAELHAYTNYVSQIMNLFELQIELYRRKLVEEDTLCTWLPWFNDLGAAPGFPDVWSDDFRPNYSNHLQRVMDLAVQSRGGLERSELLVALRD